MSGIGAGKFAAAFSHRTEDGFIAAIEEIKDMSIKISAIPDKVKEISEVYALLVKVTEEQSELIGFENSKDL